MGRQKNAFIKMTRSCRVARLAHSFLKLALFQDLQEVVAH